ncbi:conserved exported protein of unknown function [Sterolibacterium denitrificans]|uniref:Lipoprotein n=1 Tax=Sterolibacterium denitrificans TaxID=157592 RepID=A0A7Z7HSN0_9PROT|nr:hypothetical protein [Sterolibacterium denitrificans]SMB30677.1 conserved exported protein of unknown function [Sterolibacterium denitrificans]
MRLPRPRVALAILFVAVASLAACSSPGKLNATGLIPDKAFQLSSSFGLPLEKIVFWGAYAGIAYLVLDPLAPNWEIEQAPLPDNHVHLALKMKRVHAGGAGEARQLFQRRARELVQYGGFDGYEIEEYSEGVESSVLGSQRVASGVIRLTGKGQLSAVQGAGGFGFNAPPACRTAARASNPWS